MGTWIELVQAEFLSCLFCDCWYIAAMSIKVFVKLMDHIADRPTLHRDHCRMPRIISLYIAKYFSYPK
jgi:hypothetical protein